MTGKGDAWGPSLDFSMGTGEFVYLWVHGSTVVAAAHALTPTVHAPCTPGLKCMASQTTCFAFLRFILCEHAPSAARSFSLHALCAHGFVPSATPTTAWFPSCICSSVLNHMEEHGSDAG